MIMSLLFPLVMIILFGFGITTEIKNAKIAIYDPAKDQATQGIIDRLQTSEYFTIAAIITFWVEDYLYKIMVERT